MKRRNKKTFGPVLMIMLITFIIIIVSFLFSILQIRADKTSIINGNLETSVVTVKNILSLEGITYIFSNSILNLSVFEPLVLLIISLVGIGIGEKSGLFKAMFQPLKRVKTSVITALVLFISIISSLLGDYSFALILPLIGVIYKYLGKNPLLGVITAFIGTTIGYASGIVPNYDVITLGKITEVAARIEVDKAYDFNIFSSSYIMITSAIILTIFGTIFILSFINNKLPKVKNEIEEELVVDKSALLYSNFTFIIMLILLGYSIIPGLPGSGILLDTSKDTYIEMLLSNSAPFTDSIIFIITMMFMICGYIYGKVSGNIKSSNDYSVGLSRSFDNFGYVFVLMFFAAQMIGILNWTHLGEVLGSLMIDFISGAEFTGMLLILFLIFMIIIIGIFIPSIIEKWNLAAPIIVPLFMRANIAPEFTQFIFRVADGISKSITPIFSYFIVLIALLEKYDNNEKTKTTIFGTLKLILPTVLALLGIWILIIIGWYIIGLPLGVGGVTTL